MLDVKWILSFSHVSVISIKLLLGLFSILFHSVDEQTCYFRFESWVFNTEMLVLEGQEFEASSKHYVPNPQWSLIRTYVRSQIVEYEHRGTSFNFSQVDFVVELKRKSLFFVTYTVYV